MKSRTVAPVSSELPVPLHVPAHIAWNDVDGELVLFDTRDGSYHALNGTASRVWRGIARGMAPENVARDFAACFQMEEPCAQAEVARFAAEALALGLLACGAVR